MINPLLNKIIHGNCLEILKTLPDESVDLIFADPPYEVQLESQKHANLESEFDEYHEFQCDSFEDYDHFSALWLQECKRVLKPNGSLWVIGSYSNIFRLGKIIQDLKFWIINDILWIKTNPMPNFRGTRFNNAHETLIFATKSKDSQYTFHYQSMKCYNDNKQMKSHWYIPLCNGLERIKIDGKSFHGMQKPEALLYRIILSTSNVDDVILDPFSGTGTTAVVAKKLNRHFIGIEQDLLYVEESMKRLEQTKPFDQIRVLGLTKPKPRVTIGKLIEVGYLQVGQKLSDIHQNHHAILNSDASITLNNQTGTIHQMASLILETPNANGWEFWHIDYKQQFISIELLRLVYLDEFFNHDEADK